MKLRFFRTLPASDRHVIETLLDGRFHSGVSLSRDLDISRTAIWKIIQKIRKNSCPIEVHRRKGYRLMMPSEPGIEFLSEEKIFGLLPKELQEEIQMTIYHYSPQKDWGTFFFTHQRPLTNLAVCLLETQGTPPSRFGHHLHLAMAIDPALAGNQGLTAEDLHPLPIKNFIYSKATQTQKFTLIQMDMNVEGLNQDRNFLAARAIQQILESFKR